MKKKKLTRYNKGVNDNFHANFHTQKKKKHNLKIKTKYKCFMGN
jgi:hypothetical protein